MDDYYPASQERKIDFHILYQQMRHHCALYISGYVIECLLKFLLQKKGLNVPQKKEGHNLKILITKNKLLTRILAESWQIKFINFWNVEMRYRANDFERNETEAINYLRAAGRIIKIIEFEIRNQRR